jgi:hypothetical protein
MPMTRKPPTNTTLFFRLLFGSTPRSPFLQARRKPGALLLLTAALRRGIFLCVTPRRTLRNSAVKRTQTQLQPSKVFRIRPRGGLLTQAAVFPRLQADLEIPGAPPELVRAI